MQLYVNLNPTGVTNRRNISSTVLFATITGKAVSPLLLPAVPALPLQLLLETSLLPFSAGKVLILKCVACLNLWKRGDIWNQINYYRPVSVAHLPPPTSSCVTFLTQDQLPIFKQWGNFFDARQTSYFIVWYDTMKMISSARIHGRTNKDLVP